jgi:eukaryotic-like serine/threonine-protein kinase
VLDHVVRRCLEKEPEDRWQSARDVAGELLWISEAGSQAGAPAIRTVRRRTRERLAWGLAALLLVVAGALAAWTVAQVRDPQRQFRTAMMPPDGVRIPLFDENPGNAVPSPDGTKAVYRGVEGRGTASLYLHDLISGEVRVLPETNEAQYPFWSPDSRWVGFFTQRNNSLQKIDIAGGTPIRLAESINGKGGSWNEKGEILFTPDFGSAISVVSASGGAVREVTRLDVARHNSHRHPRFLPDGRRFLFLARSILPGQESSVMLGSLDGGEPREILRSGTQAEYAAGNLLFVRGSTLMAQRFDWKKGALLGEAQPIAEGVSTFGGASFAAVAAGEFILYHTMKPPEIRPLEWRDRKGEPAGTIKVAGSTRNAAISPTGRFIAASLGSPDGETDIWILDAQGGVARRLPSPGEDLNPVWSRDETAIVFSSNPKGRFGLYRRSVESGASAEPILESVDDLFVSSALPDGSGYLITRGAARPSGGVPFTVDVLKTGAKELTPAIENAFLAVVSPDGRWIAWTVISGEGYDLFVATWPALGGRRQIANRVSNLFWGHQGSELLYVDLEEKLFSVTIDPPSLPREVPAAGTPLGASPDGAHILTLAAPTELPTSTIRMIQNWQKRPR